MGDKIIRAEAHLGLPVEALVMDDYTPDLYTLALDKLAKWSFKSEEELNLVIKGFKTGYKANPNTYTEEQVRKAFQAGKEYQKIVNYNIRLDSSVETLPVINEDDFISSLHPKPTRMEIEDGKETPIYE